MIKDYFTPLPPMHYKSSLSEQQIHCTFNETYKTHSSAEEARACCVDARRAGYRLVSVYDFAAWEPMKSYSERNTTAHG